MTLWKKVKQFFAESGQKEPKMQEIKIGAEILQKTESVMSGIDKQTPSSKKNPEPISIPKPPEERQLNIGLDFGTSFTKAIIREHASSLSWAITFGQNYLLPSKVFMNGNQYNLVGKGELKDGLKWNLMNNNDNCTDTIAFIALTLRKIMDEFTTQIEPRYQNYQIDWSINVGVPSLNDTFKSTYMKVMNSALLLSLSGESINKESIQNQIIRNSQVMSEKVHLYPEIFAEVYGYSKSPQRQDGLFFIYDIGATTLDAAIFNLFRIDFLDMISIFSAFVQNYGTYKLVEMIRPHLQIQNLTPFDPFPAEHLTNPALKPIKEAFRKDIHVLNKELIINARINYPTARNWYDPQHPRVLNNPELQTQVFFAGGGANIDFYQDTIKVSSADYIDPIVANLHQYVDLDIVGSIKKRMAVAHGLSFPHFDLAEIINAKPFNNN